MTNIELYLDADPKQPTIHEMYEEIRQVYLNYPHPWVIGYSGGKDSTTALQMIWYALAELPVEERQKPVYVISSDTLVETPVIIDRLEESLELIETRAKEENLPFRTQKLSPELNDRFWVNLIGRGYPAPNSIFRWCTERLKINASNRFILEQVAENGEVILILGIRRGESATRDQVMNMHRFRGHLLARHGQLPGAWVYMPIEHFSTDDVWTYLLQVPSPWGGDNRSLASMYRSAQDGECPLVVDDSTASCGNSRFGCWVCTVVDRDRSMEAMIDSGEEWMIPLLDFRDWLAETQDPSTKPDEREYKGRDGRVRFSPSGELLWRTFTPKKSREILQRVLETQYEIQESHPEMEIISEDELREIRRLWLTERQDGEEKRDFVVEIYEQVTGKRLDWEQNDVSIPGQLDLEVMQRLAPKYDIPVRLVERLLDTEWQHYGMHRRGSIHKSIKKIINEDWRSLEQIREEVVQRRKLNEASEE